MNKEDLFWDSFALTTLALTLLGLTFLIGHLTGHVQVIT